MQYRFRLRSSSPSSQCGQRVCSAGEATNEDLRHLCNRSRIFHRVSLGGNYALRLATIFAMYATLALSWNIIGGLAGYPSFATAAFFGLGTYASAILQSSGMPMLVAWPLGGLIAAAFAAVIGLAILHLKGHYFAIASLALVEVLRELVNINDQLTGGG